MRLSQLQEWNPAHVSHKRDCYAVHQMHKKGVHKAAPHKYSTGNALKSAVVRRNVFSPTLQCIQLTDFLRIF